MAPRVLFIPANFDTSSYRSLERVESTTRTAIADRFELVELEEHPGKEADAFIEAVAKAAPLDAIVDLSDHAAHGPMPGTPSLYFALGGMPNGATFPWLRRRRLKSTDVLLMNSKSDLAIYQAALLGTGPRAELLPFGVDTTLFRPRSDDENRAVRDSIGLPADAFLILYSGRLNIQKNLHSLLLAFRAVAAFSPAAHLVLAGQFDAVGFALFDVSNDGYEKDLRDLITQWGLDDRVHFVGHLGDRDLAGLCSAADVFATLTIHNNENFGYAPVEAMAAGTPVVASHFGGLKETVVHGETGWHVETVMTDHGLRAHYRQAVAPLLELANDPELARRTGQAARKRVEELYSLDAYANNLAAIIGDAIERAKQSDGDLGDTFRFSKQAMNLHLRNLHRTYSRQIAGRPRAAGTPRVEYPTYRFFQAPYATRDGAGVTLTDETLLTLLTRCRLDRKSTTLHSLDPIWPRSYELSLAELDTIAALEAGVTVGELIARGESAGLSREVVETLLIRLLDDGIVFPDRPFTADE